MSDKSLKIGTVDAILAVKDEKTQLVEVPEWGCSVKVKSLTKAEELGLRKKSVRGGTVDEQFMEGLMLVYGIVEPKFEIHHIKDLQAKAAGPLNKLLTAILELSGMKESAQEEADEDFQDLSGS